ncbi:MAG TPA: hypothetical protein VF323_09505 [Candidatus Limnocylindrales bacterium]
MPTKRRLSAASVVVAFTFVTIGFLIASIGFAMPMALRVIDGGHAAVPAADLGLLRSIAADGGIIFVVGIVHALVGLAVLPGWRAARVAATVLAGSGVVVSVVGFVATIAAWGPFAGTGLARAGSPRMDGLGITLATVFVEALVLVALRAAERADGEIA